MVGNDMNHFVAYSFDRETRLWTLFDDSVVKPVDAKRVAIARRHALLAVYMNVGNNNNSGSNNNSGNSNTTVSTTQLVSSEHNFKNSTQ
jgi:hypothetical protein